MTQFRIDRIRFTWKGTWAGGITYTKDDIVQYGGKSYVCVVGHIATLNSVSNFWNGTSYSGFYSDLNVYNTAVTPNVPAPYWSLWFDGYTYQGAWTNGKLYNLGDIVTYGSIVYICNFSHTSIASNYSLPITSVLSGIPLAGYVTYNFSSQTITPFLTGSTVTVTGLSPSGYNVSGASVTSSTSGSVTVSNATSDVVSGSGAISGTIQAGLEFNQSYWTAYAITDSWTGGWASNTRYRVNDVVKYGGTVYRCTSVHVSRALLETDSDKWAVVAYTDKWTTDWATSTHYRINDVVRYGGIVYRCITAHNSASTNNDPAAVTPGGLEANQSSWQIVVSGVEYKSIWQATSRYKFNDVVKYGANLYICSTAHVSSSTFDTGKWGIYLAGQEYRNSWNASIDYIVGDVVKFGGYSYVATANNTNQDPSTQTTSWSLLTIGYLTMGDWSSSVSYQPGDIVRRNGGLYVATSNSLNRDPNTTNPIWTLIVSGIQWQNRWLSGVAYLLGDIVTYYATSYKCVTIHTANGSNSPLVDTSGTYWSVLVQGDHFEVLATKGDITTYTTATKQTAVAIGTPGQVLKSSGTQPYWSNYGQIVDIYYVSNTQGVDTPGYGLSINAPFATIAYACNYVLQGAYYQNTAYLINANKQWIIAEMYNWAVYQGKNSISPFTTTPTYDPYLIQRDAEYVIDSIVYDMTRGGNSQTVSSALSFFQQGTSTLTPNYTGLSSVYASAFTQLLSLIQSTVANTPPGSSYQSLNNAALANLAVSGASGTGTSATLTFASQTTVPFSLGETITVNNINPSAYNGTFVVTGLSSSSVTFSSTANGTYVNGGQIAGSTITQSINNSYTAESGTSVVINSLTNIIISALSNQSTSAIPPTNTGVTSTIFIKDGTYNEILPISIPENTAIVGDELRNTIVQPSTNSATFTGIIASNSLNIVSMTNPILSAQSITIISVGTYGTTLAGSVITVSSTTGLSTGNLFVVSGNSTNAGGLTNGNYYVGSVLSETTLTLSTSYALALAGTYLTFTATSIATTNFTAYKAVVIGMWVTTSTIYSPTQITGFVSGVNGGPGFYTVSVSQTVSLIGMTAGYTTGNMFYCRNGSGIRNMTLSGLTGTLGPANAYLTQRPTAGAYVSLDPGTGPNDTAAWIFRKSPYVQNVSTFGAGCAGLKIDGSLHNGGNKSIVANDFTQVLSDGIGVWCTGSGSLTECVSVFTYYNHAGYLSELGGKIRATNGNNSYGTYGSVAEGYDITETPLTASVNNRYYQAQVYSAFAGQAQNKILLLEYSNCGQNYTTASYSFAGAGTTASIVANEFRDNAVFETRLTGATVGLGGTGYLTAGNQSQGGNSTSITIASNDLNNISNYLGMRVIITSGTGVGQYGYITAYNIVSKVVSINTESTGIAGWDHVVPGTPIVSVLDSTSQYSIEPRPQWSAPAFTPVTATLPVASSWISVAYGNGVFSTISSAGLSASSINGSSWTSGSALPTGTYTAMTFGGNYFVAITSGSSTVAAYSSNGSTWNSSTLPASANWSSVAFGNGYFVAVTTTSSNVTAVSTSGTSWSSGGNLPSNQNWTGVAYGAGVTTFVAIAGNSSNVAAYSTNNGSTWTATTLPATANWTSVSYGNNRFVAVATGSTTAAYSFDGITWYASNGLPTIQSWTNVAYGQGLFIAINSVNAVAASSQDGLNWTARNLGAAASWATIAFGNPTVGATVTPVWAGVSSGSSTTAVSLKAGATTLGRVVVSSGSISLIKIWEPGSGYASVPTCTITDPNTTTTATSVCRLGTGVLAQPTWINRGSNYQTSTTVTTISGNGFADIYQGVNSLLICSGVTTVPTPGANLVLTGNTTQYNITDITLLSTGIYRFTLSVPIDNSLVSANGTTVTIRVKYSQVRLTGHDFLYIGTGNFNNTNYPNVPIQNALQNQQIQFNNAGRVFVVSTDQDGNFKVGNLFGVQQATGIVTINASLFNLSGVTALSIGAVSVGQNAVTITQFSTDSYFVANSDAIIPTQKAIKSYVARAISAGGSNAVTGSATAGIVGFGNQLAAQNVIFTTTGKQVKITPSMNFSGQNLGGKAGVDGSMLAMTFFANSFGGSQL